MSEMRVTIDGTYGNVPLPVTSTNTPATATNVQITDGTLVAGVSSSVPGGNNELATTSGFEVPVTTLAAVTANATGTTVDAGSAKSNWTALSVVTGTPTAGTLTIELSLDGTNWATSSVSASITAAGNYIEASTGRPARYGRVSLSALAGSATVTTRMMAAG